MPRLIKKYQSPSGPLSWSSSAPTLQDPTKMYTNYFDKSIKTDLKLPSGGFKGDPMVLGKMNLKAPTLGTKLPAPKASGSTGVAKQNAFGGAAADMWAANKGALIDAAPQALDTVAGMIGTKADVQSGGEAVFSKASDAALKMGLKSGNPIAMGIGAGLKGIDLVNQFGGKTSKKQGTLGIDTGPYTTQVNAMANKKFTLLGGGRRKAADRLTRRQDTANLFSGNVAYQGKQENLASSNMWQDIAAKNEQSTRDEQSRLEGLKALSAKRGAKINPAQLRNIVNKVKYTKTIPQEIIEEETPKFEDGGKLNVIPEGALHARKHDLPDDIAEQVTDKGIPVVTFEDGGEITQHAEIESSEIIFTKSVTDKLEKAFKEYNEASESEKERIAINTGKFLTTEILENTDDRTGLLDTIE